MINLNPETPLLILDPSQNYASFLRTVFTDIHLSYLTFSTEADIFNHLHNSNYIPIIFVTNLQQLNNINKYVKSPQNKFIDCQIPLIFLSKNHNIQERKQAFKLGAIDFLTLPLIREEIEIKIKNWLKIASYNQIISPEKEHKLGRKKDKNCAKKLKKCENRFPSLINLIKGWMWEVDLEGKFTYISPKIEEYLGLKPQKLMGKSVFEILEESDKKEMKSFWESLITNPRFFHYTKKYHLPAINQDIWLESRGIPIFDCQGKLRGYRGLDENITGQKQLETSLRESEESYYVTFEKANIGIAHVSIVGQCLKVNQKILAMFGYSKEEIVRRKWMEISHPEDLEQYSVLETQLLAGEIENYSITQRYFRKDGSLFWGLLNVSLHRDQKKQPLYFIMTIEDITDRILAEEKVKESQKKLEIITETINDVFWMTNWQKKVSIYLSKAFEDIWQYPRDALYKDHNIWLNTIHPEDRPRIIQAFSDITNKGTYHEEYRIIRPDGEVRWIEDRGYPIRDDLTKETIIVGCARDITEKKQAETEKLVLQTRNQTLVESLGEIVYEHDLTNHSSSWDGAYEELLGYSPEEMGQYDSFWPKKIHPEDIPLVKNELKPNKTTKRFFSLEYRLQAKNGEYLWFLDRGIMEYNPLGEVTKITGVLMNICDRKRVELAIRHIAKVISLKSEETFLQSLVKYLAEILPADVVFLSEIHPDTCDYATTLVYYHQGEFKTNFSYYLHNTPCQEVIYQQNPSFCLYSNNIEREYPHNQLTQNINANTYMGMALFDTNNKPIGCLVALSSHIIPDNSINREILQIFASTASAELEKQKIRLQLQQFNQQLEAKIKQRIGELEEAKEIAEEKAIALRYLNEIERLLSDISTSLFMIEAEKVDEYINDALTAIALFLKVEQISIFQFDQEKQTFTLSHQSQSSIIEEDLSQWQISTRLISWLVNQLQTKWIVMVNSVNDFPSNAITEKKLFQQLKLKSFVAFPIEFSGNVVGFLTAISVTNHHEWNQGETNLLQLTGKLFSNAIARKKSETALRETQEALSSTNKILIQEVKEREILYNKLQQSETRYRTLFESSHDALCLIDVETQSYIDGNDAAIRIHDCITKREFIGKHFSYFAPEYQPTGESSATLASRYIHEAFYTGGCFFEWSIQKKDGILIPCLVSLSAIPSQQNKVILAIIRDISVLKKVQKELEQAKEEADSANKAKSEFLASVSHEIRTPMNAILGFTHIALQNEPSGKQAQYLHKIRKACESLLSIVNDILDFSKIEAGKLELENHDFFLDSVLTDVANLLNPKTQEKGLELIFEVDSSLNYSLWGDSLRLSQILINLIDNGIKFTEKGQIIVRIQTQEFDNWVTSHQKISSSFHPASIRDKNHQEGNFFFPSTSDESLSQDVTLYCCVEDTGIGISYEKLSRLFKPFSQADGSITRKYGGTGLGLVISHRLVEMMGGEIWAESEENKGSKFYFRVNLKKGKGTCCLLTPPNLASLMSHPILVVDDNSISRQVIANILKSFSFACVTVKSGMEAIQELEKENHDYQLMILDSQMPRLNGVETLQTMSVNPKIKYIPPVLMMSSRSLSDLEWLSSNYNVKGYLSKPITKSSLFNGILNVFNPHSSSYRQSLSGNNNLYPSFECFQDCHLLLVEDNEINREIAMELLKGISIDIANNGLEAIEKIKQKKYDAVLMDISMPEMDGLEATKRIRQLEGEYFQNIPIIAMTAHAMTGDRELSLKAGMNDHIIKPINLQQLKETLRQWLPQAKIKSEKDHQSLSMVNQNRDDDNVLIPILAGINSQIALSRLMGNKSLYLRLLKQFSKSNAHKLLLIEEAIARQDYEEARSIIHAVKGVAGNIGAENLFNAAQELESSLKKKDINNIPFFAQKFYQAFQEVINSLQQLDRDSPSTAVRENHPMDYTQVKELLREIMSVLETDLTEAKRKFNYLYLLTKNSKIEDKIEEIISYFDNFELEEVYKNINKLLNLEITIND